MLRDNGYKLQLVEATAYLVKDKGKLDYVYPGVREPLFSGLRVFKNPVFNVCFPIPSRTEQP